MTQAADKPETIREKIAEGKLNSWYGESVLLDQEFVKDATKTVRDVIMEVNARTGENISVARFARFVVGESAPAGADGRPGLTRSRPISQGGARPDGLGLAAGRALPTEPGMDPPNPRPSGQGPSGGPSPQPPRTDRPGLAPTQGASRWTPRIPTAPRSSAASS